MRTPDTCADVDGWLLLRHGSPNAVYGSNPGREPHPSARPGPCAAAGALAQAEKGNPGAQAELQRSLQQVLLPPPSLPAAHAHGPPPSAPLCLSCVVSSSANMVMRRLFPSTTRRELVLAFEPYFYNFLIVTNCNRFSPQRLQ